MTGLCVVGAAETGLRTPGGALTTRLKHHQEPEIRLKGWVMIPSGVQCPTTGGRQQILAILDGILKDY